MLHIQHFLLYISMVNRWIFFSIYFIEQPLSILVTLRLVHRLINLDILLLSQATSASSKGGVHHQHLRQPAHSVIGLSLKAKIAIPN